MSLTNTPAYLKLIGWIYENPGSSLNSAAQDLHLTYSHVVAIKGIFEENKWLNTEKVGRTLILTLTESGRKVAEAYLYLKQTMEITKPKEGDIDANN